ncbi:MAG: recombinase family protein, partial [Methanomassiliicoccaceae archaeon]|nr:recombinase family protein [Methanomassiliicoccaceae archaeon]
MTPRTPTQWAREIMKQRRHKALVFDRYKDEVSGANKKRPELDRMMADAKFRRFDKIVADHIK